MLNGLHLSSIFVFLLATKLQINNDKQEFNSVYIKTYRQPITVINLTEIRKGHNLTNHKKVFKETHHSSHLHVII